MTEILIALNKNKAIPTDQLSRDSLDLLSKRRCRDSMPYISLTLSLMVICLSSLFRHHIIIYSKARKGKHHYVLDICGTPQTYDMNSHKTLIGIAINQFAIFKSRFVHLWAGFLQFLSKLYVKIRNNLT